MLQGLLYDRMHADKDGQPPTGNGRRQSYASPPIPRMTNTNILNGASKPDDILSPTPNGVYVTSLGGGQTNNGAQSTAGELNGSISSLSGH